METDDDAVERQLRQYREHLTLLMGVLPVVVYRARGVDRMLWVSNNTAEITGFDPDDLLDEPTLWCDRIHPDDRDQVLEAHASAGSGAVFTVEYRWRHRAGHYIWFLDNGRRIRLPDTDVPEAFGVALETTARREMQEQRRRLLDELISAQEVERRRISRELHDALGQTMTSLSMRIAALEERTGDAEHAAHLVGIREVAERAMRELSDLAHSLRPPAIDELGFVAALHGLVADVAGANRLAVDVHVRGLEPDGRMSPAIETCLYRMVQEALHNVLKHSKAQRASVIVDRRDNRVQLIVEDDGCGFDTGVVTETGRPRGLGLAGMRERAAILGGKVAVESRPGGGTTVRVTVPRG